MATKSLIRRWHGKAATFVEDDQNGKVIVTVDDQRIEMSTEEWNGLPAHGGDTPNDFQAAIQDLGLVDKLLNRD